LNSRAMFDEFDILNENDEKGESKTEQELKELKIQNALLKDQVKKLQDTVSQLGNGVTDEEDVLQRPTCTIKYQYLSRTVRKMMDQMMTKSMCPLVDSSAPKLRTFKEKKKRN